MERRLPSWGARQEIGLKTGHYKGLLRCESLWRYAVELAEEVSGDSATGPVAGALSASRRAASTSARRSTRSLALLPSGSFSGLYSTMLIARRFFEAANTRSAS